MNKKHIIIFKKNQRGGTAILLVVLIMSSFLVVVLTMSNLVINGFQMNRTQLDSTKAYFAAEAGAEQILWEIRRNDFNPSGLNCVNGVKFCYSSDDLTDCDSPCSSGDTNLRSLGNQSFFETQYIYASPTTTLLSLGGFDEESRVAKISFNGASTPEAPGASCPLPWDGSIFADHGDRVLAWNLLNAGCAGTCQSEMITCVDGIWTGTFRQEKCLNTGTWVSSPGAPFCSSDVSSGAAPSGSCVCGFDNESVTTCGFNVWCWNSGWFNCITTTYSCQ